MRITQALHHVESRAELGTSCKAQEKQSPKLRHDCCFDAPAWNSWGTICWSFVPGSL